MKSGGFLQQLNDGQVLKRQHYSENIQFIYICFMFENVPHEG